MTSILRISEASSLAMHTMALLAAEPDRRLSTHQIASALEASEAHLSKVMQRLSRAGLVRSLRGPRGGFVLACEPDRITLMRIHQAVDGPMAFTDCLLGLPICDGRRCILGGLAKDVNQKVKDHLERTRLSDLAAVFKGG